MSISSFESKSSFGYRLPWGSDCRLGCLLFQMKVVVLLLVCLFGRGSVAEGRRPVFIIAHMVNSIPELDEYLARGANAIETDLTFYPNGTVKQVFHGFPCDCYRVCDEKENFARYLNYVRDLANPNHAKYQESLTLLFLDLKLGEVSRSDKYKAGEEIAKYLITHLWSNDLSDPQIDVLLSVPHTSDSEAIRGVRDTFTKSNRGTSMQRLGFDVSMNDDLNAIRRMFSRLGVTANRWQGDGITNCLRSFRDDRRLRNAVRIRDSGNGFIEKVYDWTLDITTQIRRALQTGVDGIITNFPERIVSVLNDEEFRDRYRIATKNDNPFSRVQIAPYKSSLQTQNLFHLSSSMREVTIALMGYAWDFYKLRLKRPSTLLPLILQEILSRAEPMYRRYQKALRKSSRKHKT